MFGFPLSLRLSAVCCSKSVHSLCSCLESFFYVFIMGYKSGGQIGNINGLSLLMDAQKSTFER